MNLVTGLLRLMRPWQWVKSGFVFMGVLFANVWSQPAFAKAVTLAALAFSLVSSGVYVFNDLLDRQHDMRHPRKKTRPLAAKRISLKTAIAFQIILWAAGLVVGGLASTKVIIILLAYIAINLAYSVHLKHVVLLDVFCIASGFVLRILAGTIGIGIPPSQWLLFCGLMIALFLGFAKRRAELYESNDETAKHRRVLDHYQPVLLDQMIVVTATCVILSYSLYTMSPETIQYHHTQSLIYTVPFVMYAMFRYMYSLHRQTTGGDPATEIFRDPHLLVAIGGWLVTTYWLIS